MFDNQASIYGRTGRQESRVNYGEKPLNLERGSCFFDLGLLIRLFWHNIQAGVGCHSRRFDKWRSIDAIRILA